jgi:hypothetical protein
MPACTTYFSNTGDQIIHVETTGVDLYVDAASMESKDLTVGSPFNIKLTKGRDVKRFT